MADQDISAGTQVVSRVEVRGTNNSLVHPRGAVGVVTRTPAVAGEKFLVRFPDGFEFSLQPDQLEVLKHFKARLGSENGVLPAQTENFDLESLVIYRCVVGSRAYGLIVHTTSEQEELNRICAFKPGTDASIPFPEASGVITKHHSHHYFGFAETQWKLFLRASPRRVKPLLYVYRVLLTGIPLMRTGEVEANLTTLNKEFRLAYIADLVARKLAGPEDPAVGQVLTEADVSFHQAEYERLRGELSTAHESSRLPEVPSEETRAALNDLLVRIRLSRE